MRNPNRRLVAAAAVILVGAGVLIATPAGADDIDTVRFDGADRFATAVEVSQYWERFDPGLGVVYIANGLSFADALSAAPAAAYQGGPLLLVGPDTLPGVVRDELTRLNPYTIKVIGGEGTISTSVEDDLQAYVQASGDVIRIAGVDRYATSRAVVTQAFTGHLGTEINAFIATGVNFPDALASAGAAGANKMPVILVNGGAASLDAATLNLIDTLNYTRINIAGGIGTVSTGIENSLDAQSFVDNVIRFAGGDRYETGAIINDYWFDTPTAAFLANGLGFADALAAGARAGFTQIPLYTTDPNCLPRSVADSLFGFGTVNTAYLLGGLGSLSANIDDLVPCDEME